MKVIDMTIKKVTYYYFSADEIRMALAEYLNEHRDLEVSEIDIDFVSNGDTNPMPLDNVGAIIRDVKYEEGVEK